MRERERIFIQPKTKNKYIKQNALNWLSTLESI